MAKLGTDGQTLVAAVIGCFPLSLQLGRPPSFHFGDESERDSEEWDGGVPAPQEVLGGGWELEGE